VRRVLIVAAGVSVTAFFCLTGTSLAFSGGYHSARSIASGYSDCMTSMSQGYTGAPVAIYPCNGNSAQTWYFSWTPAGYLLENEYSGKCVDDRYNSGSNGAALIQYPCNPNDQAQLFVLSTPYGWSSDTFQARKYGSNLCIDDPYGSATPGQNLDLWSCYTTVNQFWSQG